MKLAILPLVFSIVGCLKPLAPQDVSRLKYAQRESLSIYQDGQVGPLARQRARATFCLIETSLKSAHADTYDSKGAIECPSAR